MLSIHGTVLGAAQKKAEASQTFQFNARIIHLIFLQLSRYLIYCRAELRDNGANE